MEVLIVAKTSWGDFFCISAIELSSNNYIRLMQSNGGYQPKNTQYKIGQIWDLDYIELDNKPPHIEDVAVTKATYVRIIPNIKQYIISNCNIWNGGPTCLYTNKLKWHNGSGYLNDKKNVPTNSVGFWISDKDLIYDNQNYYKYNTSIFTSNKKIKYKGELSPLPIITSGTLIRVSLAKWWKMNPNTEERCYLQISGWYI